MSSHGTVRDAEFSDELCMQPAYLWPFQMNQKQLWTTFRVGTPRTTFRQAQSWHVLGTIIGRKQRRLLISRGRLSVLLVQRLIVFRNEHAVRSPQSHAARILSQRHVSGLKNESVGGMSCYLSLTVNVDGKDGINESDQEEMVRDCAFHPCLPIFATASRFPRLWRLNHDCSAVTYLATMFEGQMSQDRLWSRVGFVVFHSILPIAAVQDNQFVKLWRFGFDPPFVACIARLKHGYDRYIGRESDDERFSGSALRSVAFHPRLAVLASCTHHGNVMLWQLNSDCTDASCVAVLAVGGEDSGFPSLKNVVFHPFLPLLATSSNYAGAQLWRLNADCTSATIIATIQEHLSGFKCVAFHPKLLFIATSSRDWTAKLWRLTFDDSGCAGGALLDNVAACVATLGEGFAVFQLGDDAGADMDETHAVGGKIDASPMSIEAWVDEAGQFDTERWHATMHGHCGSVKCVAFHPDLPIAVTCSKDSTAKLWSLNRDGTSASPIASLRGHSSIVWKAKFHPRLPIVVTCSIDGTVKFWR